MALDLQLFSDKLRRCREQLALTLEEVSQATGIGEAALAAFENGKSSPTGDEILILADFYRCDYKFFLSNERLTALEQTETLFRRFGEEFSKEDRWAVVEVLFLADVEAYLQRALREDQSSPFIFEKSGSYFIGHGEQASSALRVSFGYRDNAVPRNIYDDFRAIGIHVFRRRLGNSNISGLYIRHPIAGQCILVNYSEDVYRQRFTAAHEAGHAILDREEDVVVSLVRRRGELQEIRANAFASHYLMPPAFLRRIPESGTWDSEKALHWASALRVSTEALAIALVQSQLIDSRTADTIRAVRVPTSLKEDPELPRTLSPRTRERKEHLLERGLSDYYVNLCFHAYREGIVSAARLAEILLLDGETALREFAELYGEALRYAN